MEIKKYIRDVPDYPTQGITFKDITPLLQSPQAFSFVIDQLVNQYQEREITALAAIESRGFIFGVPVALALQVPFIPIRKRGKLPSDKIEEHYDLEYGTDAIEIHEDALKKGDRVLIIDDLLATGGTASAACKLVHRCQASIVSVAFIIELGFLKGRDKLAHYEVFSLINYGLEQD